MAEAKKPSFPNKPCPRCKEPIHIRSHKHEKCGWEMKKFPAAKTAPAAAKRKPGRPAGSKNKKVGRPAGSTRAVGGISLADIQAVKALADKLGAKRVKEIADVLA